MSQEFEVIEAAPGLVDVKVEIFSLVSYRLDRCVKILPLSPIHILLNERTKIVNRNMVEYKVNSANGVSRISNKDVDLKKKLFFSYSNISNFQSVRSA